MQTIIVSLFVKNPLEGNQSHFINTPFKQVSFPPQRGNWAQFDIEIDGTKIVSLTESGSHVRGKPEKVKELNIINLTFKANQRWPMASRNDALKELLTALNRDSRTLNEAKVRRPHTAPVTAAATTEAMVLA